jgi:pimeloyl-ACP methyl ester carboxylesterase
MEELESIGLYERHGDGPAVLILSNPAADPRWWAVPFVSALVDAGYEVITFIHLGESFRPEDVVRDVAALIERLRVGPVRLLGWSQGAAIAQEVALLRPDLVVAAALIATYGRQNTFDRLLQASSDALATAGRELDPVRLVMSFLTSHPAPLLGEDSYVDPLIDGLRQWSAKSDNDTDRRQRSAEFIAGYQERLDALAGVRVPCLVMGFGQDTDTFVARARQVAQAIPASQYLELADAAHLAPVTDPPRVIRPVLHFFANVDR